MRKKLICLILAITLLCSTVVHGISYFPMGHAAGEAYRTVNAENCISVNNAETLSDGSVQINPGGKATFGFYTPYGLRGVKLVYDESAAGTALTITTTENQYDVTLPTEGGEYTFLFHEILGKEKQDFQYSSVATIGYQREYVEHRGEHEVTVSSKNGILLKEMVFEKEHVVVKKTPARLPAVTDETSATYSTVMIDENAPIIVANGGKRFVDYNDPSMRPYKYNGRLYLPINTLAKALEYYHEDYPEKGYALMRSDTHDVVFLDGKCWIVEGVSEKKAIDDVIIHRDGITLAAVRFFGELIGDTVGYQDGLVVIDNKYTVQKILTSGSLNNFAKNIFKPFKTASVEGKTYYVAQKHPAASDNGTGSVVAPFKTVSKAAEIAKPGDTVIVKEGIYRETLRPKNSGTANAPITFMAAEGENVVISAADVVDGWAHYDGNVWTAPMGWDLGVTRNQVFINDKMLNEARYPNGPEILYDTEKLDNAWAVKGDLWRPAGEANSSIVRSSTLLWQKEPDYWKGGYYVGHYGLDYAVMTADIVGSKEGELTLGHQKTDMWYTDESYFAFGYIVGHMNCLDAPGEWIRQDDTLYMIFPDGATPNKTLVEAKARQLVIDLKDRNYVHVKGFKTIGGGARTNDGQMNMLNDLDMKYISHYIHQSASYKGEVDFPFDPKNKNGNPERGESGIFLSGSDNHVVNCNIDHTAGAGIFVSGLYSYIENNIIHDSYNSNYVSGIQIMNRGYDDVTKPIGGTAIFNNTVYRTGRSCLNISTQKGVGNQLYLPGEVAYNDFHDAMMSTLDTGITYEYDVEQSIDGYYSRLHHNYVYMLVGGKDKNPYTFAIYHDGGSHGFDTYKNQIFYTSSDSPFGHAFVYMQTATAAPAFMHTWDNGQNLISNSVDGLGKQYFTEEKAFYAGAMRDTETMEPVNYTINYDRFANGQFTMEHSVANTYKKNKANLSAGVIYDEESGYAAFTGNDQYVRFENVSFPEGSNAMAMMFRGDSHYSHDAFEVIIGESIESGKRFEGMVDLNGYDLNSPERHVVELEGISGTYDVWIKINDYKSAELGGISVYCDELYITNESEEDSVDYFTAYRWAGDFTDRIQFSGTGNGPQVLALNDYPGKNLMNETWAGWYVKYDDVEIAKESDKFVMAAGSGGDYAHQPFEIYIEDKNSTEPSDKYIARYLEDSDKWADRDPQVVELDTVVKPGTYDVYVKLCDDAGYGKSSTVVYIGFLATGPLPEQIIKGATVVYGGGFDAAKSIQNPDFPFKATYMNPPNYAEKGLSYTLPGTCAVYSGVTLLGDCNTFEVTYASEDGLDGQTVEVWIGDPSNRGWKATEFVTESKGGITVFEELSIPCTEVVSAGVYDIYLKFGGDKDSRKTCNIEKFNFTYKYNGNL